MKKSLLTTMIALVLVGTVSLSAYGYGSGWGPKEKRMGLQNLNLSMEQEQKILKIRQDFQKDTQTLRFEMQKLQLELRQLWSAQTLNRDKIEAKTKEITGLRVQLVTKARAMQEKIKTVLTAEQLKKLQEYGFDRNPGANWRGRRGGPRKGSRSLGAG